MTKIICNQCSGEYNVKDVLQGKAEYNILDKINYDDGGNYYKARTKHLNTRRHQKYLEERYDANPKFWDKVYRENVKKINEMNKKSK